MTDTWQVLLAHHLKTLKLPTFLPSSTTRSPGSAPRKASITSATC